MANEIERCSKCGGVIALIGRVHLCRPVGRSSAGSEQRSSNPPVAGSSPVVPAKPTFGEKLIASVKEGIEIVKAKPKRARDPLLAQGAGPAPAKKAASTYDHRDPAQRREYQRELMRKRRAKVKVHAV